MRWVALLTICVTCAIARADDWGVKRDPFDRVVIARYKAILAKQPHDPVLAPLTALYKGYRTVALLESEYRKQLEAAPNDWATLVVLARMPRDRKDSLALWTTALDANPQDGRGWMAFGKLSHDPKTARAAFKHAVELAANPRDKKAALVELIGAARSGGDHETVDASYSELIALAPKDGQLWLDRGDALLAANRPGPALDSFTEAEALLAIDPERRLVAMTSRGVALERTGRVDDALAQWDATLDKTPRSSYQVRDIVSRIVSAERTRKRIPAAIARLEKRWKEAQRQYYEWDLLGDLALEAHDDEHALAAFQQAIKRAPTEVETQRKLIRLLDQLRPGEALAQHEAAARIAPGDANLQIELAKRYHDKSNDDLKAYAVLDRLTKRHAKSAGVRQAMGEVFTQWEDKTRALYEYEAVANLEPDEPDHAVTLGDLYWNAGQHDKAIDAWLRLAKIKTAPSQLRLGEIMTRREQWNEAEAAYSRAVELSPTTAEAWRGRSRANAELNHRTLAIEDASRAIALLGPANAEDGQRMRFELVRALGHRACGRATCEDLVETLTRWRFAFEHGDNNAGYLLVAHHTRIQSHQQHEILVELYRRVPTDDSLGLALARSYSRRKQFDRARDEYNKIAARSPKKADDIKYLLEQVEDDRRRDIEQRFREQEGFVDRDPPKRLVDRKTKIGIKSGVGTDVEGTASTLTDFAVYTSGRLGKGSALLTQIGWLRRDDQREHVDAFTAAFTYVRRVLSLRRFEVAAGFGPRLEIRGNRAMGSPLDRAALDGDVVLQLLPRSLPAVLGARFQRQLTDEVRGSAVLFELGFEWRQ